MSNNTNHYNGIKLDIQAVDVTLGDTVQEEIRHILDRLSRHISTITWADVHFENHSGKSTDQKKVTMRLGIPGPDVFASDSGSNYMALLKSVEEKLRRQLEKQH